MQPARLGLPQRAPLKSVFIPPQFECFLATFSDSGYLVLNDFRIYCSSALYLAASLVSGFHVIATDHQLCIAIHNKVRVVARKDQLASFLCLPYLFNDLSLVTILSGFEINNFAGQSAKSVCYNLVAMFDLFRLWLGAVLRGFRTHRSLMLENLALRQELAVFKRQQPRPRLGAIDKLFWVVARRFWAHWKKALLIVLPDTVARWHRSGFKLYWAMLCKVRNPVGGGRRISQQIRELIFHMVADNPSWGAPRIHGELLT
jgi:hypothetical protein